MVSRLGRVNDVQEGMCHAPTERMPAVWCSGELEVLETRRAAVALSFSSGPPPGRVGPSGSRVGEDLLREP